MNINKEFDGLSVRVRNCLIYAEYKTKTEVVAAIESGELQKQDIPNLGPKGLKELMEWCGVREGDDIVKHEVWDVKSIKICIREDEFIEFVIFGDSDLNIYESGRHEKDSQWNVEGVDIEAAKRLRDFLIYAIPKDK